jgi:sugar lactone lactonase YvrE
MQENLRVQLTIPIWAASILLTSTLTAQEYTFTTLAGPDVWPSAIDGIGSTARFHNPTAVAVDNAGNLFVTDGSYYNPDSFCCGNQTVRKVTPAGVVTTLAGLAGSFGAKDGTGSAARFTNPKGVAVDSAGNVYVADSENHTIRKVTPAGVVTTLAGRAGSPGFVNATGSAARFNYPDGVAVDNAGNVYVAESINSAIRKVTPSGVVTTLASNLSFPSCVAVDKVGELYVGVRNAILKVTQGGVVTTLAGVAGGDCGGQICDPKGVAVDSAGNVYVANGTTILKVTTDGVVTMLAGLAGSPGSSDGVGSDARFNGAIGVAVDSTGNLYVTDQGNSTIRKLTPDGTVTTIAGLAVVWSEPDVDAASGAARFAQSTDVAVDSVGNVYVAEPYATIRKITPTGEVSTLAGSFGQYGSADGIASAAQFEDPWGIAVDLSGNVYVAERSPGNTIRKITPVGEVTTLAGLAGSGCDSVDGTGSDARFCNPNSVAVDDTGIVYVADTGNNTIRRITPDGTVTTVAGLAGSTGNADGIGGDARFNGPFGIAVDNTGSIYVADIGNHTIRKLTPDGVVTTFAGSPGQSGTNDGPGSVARFFGPASVTVDNTGNVFVGDGTTRKITPDGIVSTLAVSFLDDGAFVTVAAVDSAGKLYGFGGNFGYSILVGTTNTCPDQAIIDSTSATVGQTRQLDTSPQTAVAWQWSLIRQPSASSAKLSATNVRNPTFTPDVADLYVFRLFATNATGAICIRTVSLTATPQPPQLTINAVGGNVILAWPTNATGFTLQSATDLGSSAVLWTAVSPAPAIVNGQFTVTNPITGTQRFFRLTQ